MVGKAWICVLLVSVAAAGCRVASEDVVVMPITSADVEPTPETLAAVRVDPVTIPVLSPASVWDGHVIAGHQRVESQIHVGVFAFAAGELCAERLSVNQLRKRLTPDVVSELAGMAESDCPLYTGDRVAAAPLQASAWEDSLRQRFDDVVTWRDYEAFENSAREACDDPAAYEAIGTRQTYSRSEAEQLMGLIENGECALLEGTVTTLVFHAAIPAGTAVADVLAEPEMYVSERTIAEELTPDGAINSVKQLEKFARLTFRRDVQAGHQLAARDLLAPNPADIVEGVPGDRADSSGP